MMCIRHNLNILLPGVLALLLFAGVASADAPAHDGIVGDWLVDSRDAVIRIDGIGEGDSRRYFGHIVWLKDARYHPQDGAELDGKAVMDLNNPDPALRSRPMLGLRLLWDLRYEDSHWVGGRIYDSDHGHTFDCTVQLKDPDHLRLHAYVLHWPLLGGSTIWTRSTAPPADAPAATSSTTVR